MSSFVGTYTVHGTITGTGQHLTGTLHIKANGTVTDQNGQVAHWTSSGKTITITYTSPTIDETFVGKQSTKAIGSKKHLARSPAPAGLSGTRSAPKTAG